MSEHSDRPQFLVKFNPLPAWGPVLLLSFGVGAAGFEPAPLQVT
jgi:hypothetical protein